MSLYKSVLRILSFLLILVLFRSCGGKKADNSTILENPDTGITTQPVEDKTSNQILSGLKNIDCSKYIKGALQYKVGLRGETEFPFESDDMKAECTVKWEPNLEYCMVENSIDQAVKTSGSKKFEIKDVGVGYRPIWKIYPEELYKKNNNMPYSFNATFFVLANGEITCRIDAVISLDNMESKHFEELSQLIAEKVSEGIQEKYNLLIETDREAREFYSDL